MKNIKITQALINNGNLRRTDDFYLTNGAWAVLESQADCVYRSEEIPATAQTLVELSDLEIYTSTGVIVADGDTGNDILFLVNADRTSVIAVNRVYAAKILALGTIWAKAHDRPIVMSDSSKNSPIMPEVIGIVMPVRSTGDDLIAKTAQMIFDAK